MALRLIVMYIIIIIRRIRNIYAYPNRQTDDGERKAFYAIDYYINHYTITNMVTIIIILSILLLFS